MPRLRLPAAGRRRGGAGGGEPARLGLRRVPLRAGAGPRIRELAGAVAAHLRLTPPDRLRRRQAPGVWSPLEHACHVRDVLLVQRERVLVVRRGFGGPVEPMGRDERVEHDGYADQRPADVAVQVEQAALLFAGVLARLGPGDWDRTVGYGFPEPARRSLRWVAVHTEHEVAHHLADIRAQPGAGPPS
ncbi:MAG TPA: DinB family protein [Acidimicrobiales bacterium]